LECVPVCGLRVCRGVFEVNTVVAAGVVIDPSLDPGGVVAEAALITHGHADHFSYAWLLRGRGARVYAPRHCVAFVENPLVNHMATIGWAGEPPDTVTLHFHGRGVRVDVLVEEGPVLELEGLRVEAYSTPGHTPGHHSYLVETGSGRVLVAGDVVYGEEYLRRYPLLYHTHTVQWMRSLEKLARLDPDALIPGHGSPVEGAARARRLIEMNMDKVDEMMRLVEGLLGEECIYFDEAIASAARATGLSRSRRAYSVLSPTVRALLLALHSSGRASMELKDGVPCWLRAGR